MSIVDDFSSIGARLSEIEKKIPKPESDANPLAESISQTWMERQVVWTPEDGYVTREPEQEQVVCMNSQVSVAVNSGFDWAEWRQALARAQKDLARVDRFGNFINVKI